MTCIEVLNFVIISEPHTHTHTTRTCISISKCLTYSLLFSLLLFPFTLFLSILFSTSKNANHLVSYMLVDVNDFMDRKPVQKKLKRTKVPKMETVGSVGGGGGIVYESSVRGNRLLHYMGHKYIKNNVHGANIYWKCTKWHNGCKARAITNSSVADSCSIKNVHNHGELSAELCWWFIYSQFENSKFLDLEPLYNLAENPLSRSRDATSNGSNKKGYSILWTLQIIIFNLLLLWLYAITGHVENPKFSLNFLLSDPTLYFKQNKMFAIFAVIHFFSSCSFEQLIGRSNVNWIDHGFRHVVFKYKWVVLKIKVF